MKVNFRRLHAELVAAGIPIDSVDAEGHIVYKGSATQAQRQRAAEILAAHDATKGTPEEETFIQRRTQGQTLNGKAVRSLTASDVQDLVALWLAREGWLGEDGRIRIRADDLPKVVLPGGE